MLGFQGINLGEQFAKIFLFLQMPCFLLLILLSLDEQICHFLQLEVQLFQLGVAAHQFGPRAALH